MKIEQTKLTEELRRVIFQGFTRHAIAQTGHDGMSDSVAFIARDDDGQFVGAVVAQLFWGALHIKYVYVEDALRGKGIATHMMNHALKYGKENRSPFAFVETMSFQALDFYQKMGFQIDFTRGGYNHNTSFHYLSKKLT